MTLIQQQRLLGAALLVCLIGVIAWLLLATVEENQPAKPQQEPIAFDSVIEPIAEDDIELIEPTDEVLVDSQNPDIEALESNSSDLVTLAESQPEADTVPAPAPAPAPAVEPAPTQPQWVLQVASFTDKTKADALHAQVKKLGYDPMIETAQTSGKTYYRVRLKPTADRRQLEKASGELDKALRVTTQILTYQP